MSEKRFSWIAEKTGQHYEISIRDGDEEYTISDDFFKSKDVVAVLVACLNELADENEQLRQSVEYWQKKYEEGTETLEIGEQQTTIEQLKKENEKLKEERQRLIYHLNKEPKR